MISCPKCGAPQDGTEECMRCGIVFRKFRRHEGLPEAEPRPVAPVQPEQPGLFRRFYRVFRWVTLGILIVALGLLLRDAPPPAVQTAPDADERASQKVNEFKRMADAGAPSRLQLSEAELNGWIQTNLTLKNQPPKASEIAHAVMSGAGTVPPTASQEGSISDIRMNLVDDRLRAWVQFEVRGIGMTLELEGRLISEGGYLRLQPISGRLGSLPLSQSMLDEAARKLFDSAENREKFRLPDAISDIRVENSELTVQSR